MSAHQIHILQENPEWTEPLERALQEVGAPYRVWDMSAGVLALEQPPEPGVYFNRMSASAHTRGHGHAPEFTAQVLRWLEAGSPLGTVRVLNGSRTLQLELSKAAQHLAMQAVGIRTPETLVARGRAAILQAANDISGTRQRPFIVKHNRGGKGLGVHRYENVAALESAWSERHNQESMEPVDGLVLVQRYVEPPEPFITRCEFIGGELLYAVRVNTSDGFELCPADVCDAGSTVCTVDDVPADKFTILDNFASPLTERYKALLKAHDTSVAGIEFIVDTNGHAYTYDINTNTNYNSAAESRVDKRGHLALAEYLAAELGSLDDARPVRSIAS
ncbi:MAG: alpha-L-glutamate ligase [Pseudomonadota bacterium]